MKRVLVIIFCMILFRVYSDDPIGYNDYYLPQEVRDALRATNNLRDLPEAESSYTAPTLHILKYL